MLLLVMMVFSLITIVLISQTQLQTLSYGGLESLRNESLRAKENLKVVWLNERQLIITNTGETNTTVRYLYFYEYEKAENVPIAVRSIDIHLPVRHSVLINLASMGLLKDMGSLLEDLDECPPGSGNEKPNSYYLCPDDYTNYCGSSCNCDLECIKESANSFPSKDRLIPGVQGLALMRTTEANAELNAKLSAMIPEFNVQSTDWSVCAWLKVDEDARQDDTLLQFTSSATGGGQGIHFRYSASHDKIYAEVSTSNPSRPLGLNAPISAREWHHYCVVTNSTRVMFYVDGYLWDYTGASGDMKIPWMRLDSNVRNNYYVDSVTAIIGTMTQGQVIMLSNFEKPNMELVSFSFDYGLIRPDRVDAVTDLGNKFTAEMRASGILGVPPTGG